VSAHDDVRLNLAHGKREKDNMRIGVDTNVLDRWEWLSETAGTEHSILLSVDVLSEYLTKGEEARANLLALSNELGSRLVLVDLNRTLCWEREPPHLTTCTEFSLDAGALAAFDLRSLAENREQQRAKEWSRLTSLVESLKANGHYGEIGTERVRTVLADYWKWLRDVTIPNLPTDPKAEDYKAHLLHLGGIQRLGLGAGRAKGGEEEALRDPAARRNRNNGMDVLIMAAYAYADVVVSEDQYFRTVLSRLVSSFGFETPVVCRSQDLRACISQQLVRTPEEPRLHLTGRPQTS